MKNQRLKWNENSKYIECKSKTIFNWNVKSKLRTKFCQMWKKNSTSNETRKVNFVMAECCHYRHGNAAESEIKNEFQTKLEKQVKMNFAERCHYHHATRASILQVPKTVPKQATTKKICERKKVWRRIHRGQTRIIMQRMSSEVTGKQQKYTRIGPLQFVCFKFDKNLVTGAYVDTWKAHKALCSLKFGISS